MANPAAEILDVFFNGRKAPREPKVIRLRITEAQMSKVKNGSTLQFSAAGISILIEKK